MKWIFGVLVSAMVFGWLLKPSTSDVVQISSQSEVVQVSSQVKKTFVGPTKEVKNEVVPAPMMGGVVINSNPQKAGPSSPSQAVDLDSRTKVSPEKRFDSPTGLEYSLGFGYRVTYFDKEKSQLLVERSSRLKEQLAKLSGLQLGEVSINSIAQIRPRNTEEAVVPFDQLRTDCPALKKISFAASMRISPEGNVVEALDLSPLDNGDLPKELYDCHFEGGDPSSIYVTYYANEIKPLAD